VFMLSTDNADSEVVKRLNQSMHFDDLSERALAGPMDGFI